MRCNTHFSRALSTRGLWETIARYVHARTEDLSYNFRSYINKKSTLYSQLHNNITTIETIPCILFLLIARIWRKWEVRFLPVLNDPTKEVESDLQIYWIPLNGHILLPMNCIFKAKTQGDANKVWPKKIYRRNKICPWTLGYRDRPRDHVITSSVKYLICCGKKREKKRSRVLD